MLTMQFFDHQIPFTRLLLVLQLTFDKTIEAGDLLDHYTILTVRHDCQSCLMNRTQQMLLFSLVQQGSRTYMLADVCLLARIY